MANVQIAGGEARPGQDYLASTPLLVIIPTDMGTKIIIALRDNKEAEGDEIAILALGRVESAITERGRAITQLNASLAASSKRRLAI